MAALKRAWRSYGRASGADIAKLAIVVYLCEKCGLWHERPNAGVLRGPPSACNSCGWLGFTRFDSKKEAQRWAALLLQVRAGVVADLERQIRCDLLTIHHATGKPVKFGTYVADFRYRIVETGEVVTEDVKGGAISPDAALKLRIMEASGRTVTLS